MNILDDNSENILLEKTLYGKILLIGIGIPVVLTLLIFYYLFNPKTATKILVYHYGDYRFAVSKIKIIILTPILCTLIIFLFTIAWTKNISHSKNLLLFFRLLVLFFLIISILLTIFGGLDHGGWTAYPFLSNVPESLIEMENGLRVRFQRVSILVYSIGIFSLWTLCKTKNNS